MAAQDDPAVAPTDVMTIAEVRNEPLGTAVTVEAVVTRIDGDDTPYVQDSTAGIAVFDNAVASAVSVGDSVRVEGTLDVFAGLLEIVDVGDAGLTVLGSNQPLPDPQPRTLSEIAANGEALEAELVEVSNLTFDAAGGTFSGGTNYTISDGSGGSVELRVPDGSFFVGTTIPSNPVTFSGVLGQFNGDFGSILPNEGYQLLALQEGDLSDVGGPAPPEELTIAEARQTDGLPLVVEGTVTRAFGSYARIQDDSGPTGASGIVLRQTGGPNASAFQQDVADGTIAPGTTLRVTGTVSAFAGLVQINNSDLDSYEVVGSGAVPAAQSVTLSDLAGASGEDFESERIRLDGLSFPDSSAGGTFAGGTTYAIQNADGTVFELRVQNSDETNVIDAPIPTGAFAFDGVLGQFDGFTGNDEGYQLVPVRPSDIQANEPPTIAGPENQTAPEDSTVGPLSFSIDDPDTPIADLTVSATSSDSGLVAPDGLTLGGSGTERTLTVTPERHATGETTIELTVDDGRATATESFQITFTPVNDAPVLSTIENQTVPEDGTTGTIPFTVTDPDTPLSDLTVTGTTGAPEVVPDSGVVVEGSGASRIVEVTPAPNATGTAPIALTASDGSAQSTTNFLVTVTPVNDPPTVSAIDDRTIPEDSTTGPIPFTIADPDTTADALSLAVTSSAPAVVPDSGLTLGGAGADRTVTVTPAPDTSGASTITLTVSDGTVSDTTQFEVVVTPVGDPPVLATLSDQTIPEDSTTGPLPLPVEDPDTPVDSLTTTVTSSDTTLLPGSGLALDGTGSDQTLTITPAPNQVGTATVSVSASDGARTTTTTVGVTVTPVNDAPTVTGALPDDTLALGGPPRQWSGLRTALFDDVDGDTLTLSASSDAPSVVTATVTAHRVSLAPQSVGSAQITISASDGEASAAIEPFTITVVEPAPGTETPTETVSAVVDSAGPGPAAVDLGDTGTEVTFQNVETGGTVDAAFFDGRSENGSAATTSKSGAVPAFVPSDSFATVSRYRWALQAEGVTFDSVDVRFRLSDADVVGIGDPSAVTVVQDANGDGDFDAVRTAFSDRGTPADSTDDVLVAQGLTDLGTFRFASDSDQNPLPVELASFTATRDAQAAVLSWRTASETNNAGFEVQHQPPEASGFREVGFVEGAGTTQSPQSYRFRAEGLAPGTHRFRLRQVDGDGRATLTDPVTVTMEAERALTLQATGPNPVRQSTQFAFTVQQSERAEVTLYNVLGQRVRTLYAEEASAGQRHAVTVETTDLPSGTYFVRLAAPSGTRTQRIVVVR